MIKSTLSIVVALTLVSCGGGNSDAPVLDDGSAMTPVAAPDPTPDPAPVVMPPVVTVVVETPSPTGSYTWSDGWAFVPESEREANGGYDTRPETILDMTITWEGQAAGYTVYFNGDAVDSQVAETNQRSTFTYMVTRNLFRATPDNYYGIYIPEFLATYDYRLEAWDSDGNPSELSDRVEWKAQLNTPEELLEPGMVK